MGKAVILVAGSLDVRWSSEQEESSSVISVYSLQKEKVGKVFKVVIDCSNKPQSKPVIQVAGSLSTKNSAIGSDRGSRIT